jgi:putative nicotinate phosphoribosyltransferase
MNTFDTQSYKARLQVFPEISYEEFQTITDLQVRRDIAKKNKIIQTDAYNRTMNFLKGDRSQKKETFSLSFRRSPNQEYVVVDGIRSTLKDILGIQITQAELDFAKAFYAEQKARGGNWYFDAQMWQEVVDMWWFIPLDIKAVKDGTVVKPKEPVMLVSGPAELAAVYEPIFLRAFFKSIVATDAHYLEEIIGQGRVAEFGKRATPNEDFHLDAVEANIVGWGLKVTSNDTAALVYPQILSGGTTAHRYFACYPTEDEAFLNAIEKTDKIALLVDLVDSYRGIDKIVALKKIYRASGKIIAMRLDSWDLADQAVYALKKLQEQEMLDPQLDKIVVADISTVDDVRRVERAVQEAGFDPKQFIQYGLGGLLVARNKTRDALSAAYKLTNTEDGATGKLSNDIDKEPIPGDTNIEIRDNVRYIVQENEEVRGERLLNTVYANGELQYDDNDLQAVSDARDQLLKTFALTALKTKESELTQKIHQEVRARLLSN